ncbi:MAG: hypothetical protein ACQEUB_02715 [Thermodesulfobacteriota bacterium]
MLWLEPSSWREVQTALDHHMRLYSIGNTALISQAEAIAVNLQEVDPIMDGLCAKTCPDCSGPCCLHADVRYDFRDLVFLHCRQKALPLHQPKQHPGQPCSFLGQNGCVLPRSLRPFLCTWYVCPQQMQELRDSHSPDMAYLQPRLRIIQEQRKDLETEFINLVAFEDL